MPLLLTVYDNLTLTFVNVELIKSVTFELGVFGALFILKRVHWG
jgi:hypothetical protein